MREATYVLVWVVIIFLATMAAERALAIDEDDQSGQWPQVIIDDNICTMTPRELRCLPAGREGYIFVNKEEMIRLILWLEQKDPTYLPRKMRP